MLTVKDPLSGIASHTETQYWIWFLWPMTPTHLIELAVAAPKFKNGLFDKGNASSSDVGISGEEMWLGSRFG
jgi:hypothetical protein